MDGAADGRGLRVARAGPGVRVDGVRAARARRHVRRHGRPHLRRAARAALRVRAAAPPAARGARSPPAAARARDDAARRPQGGGQRHLTSSVRRVQPLADSKHT